MSKKGCQNDWFGTHKGKLLIPRNYYYTIDIGNNKSLEVVKPHQIIIIMKKPPKIRRLFLLLLAH
jgi:hypothetical protein